MPLISLTGHLRRHVELPAGACEVPGSTVAEAMAHFFAHWPAVRPYVLEDSGAVRKHVTVFVDGGAIRDRASLTDPVRAEGEIFIMQALSGG